MLNKFKKIIALILSVVIVFTATVIASAKATPTFYIEQCAAVAGETIVVPVCISNNPGIMGFSVVVEYDSDIFTPIQTIAFDILSAGTLNDNIGTGKKNIVKTVFTASENICGDGILFFIEFSISESAQGNYDFKISYLQSDTFNEDWEDVIFECISSTTNIIKSDVESPAVFSVESVTGYCGDKVRVAINAENALGAMDFTLKIGFDKSVLDLTKVEVTDSTDSANGTHITDYASNYISFSYSGVISEEGPIYYLNFDIQGYDAGVQDITISCEKISFIETFEKDVVCKNGMVEIVNPFENEYCYAYTVDEVVLKEKQIEVPVKLINNNGIMGFGMNIYFDNSLVKVVDVVKTKSLNKGNFDYSVSVISDGEESAGMINVVWNHSENMLDDGEIFSIVFELTGDEIPDEIPVAFEVRQEDSYNENWEDVSVVFDPQFYMISLSYIRLNAFKTQLHIGEKTSVSGVCRSGGEDIDAMLFSTNPAVAKVESDGTIIAVGSGSATIIGQSLDGKLSDSIKINVSASQPNLKIYSFSDSFDFKVNLLKKYSSATMNLGYKVQNCEKAVSFKWSSSNKKVKIDQNGKITNTGNFARSSTITLTAYDAQGNVVAKSSVKVRFFKLKWQLNKS